MRGVVTPPQPARADQGDEVRAQKKAGHLTFQNKLK